jgi:PRTRC genetic system protein B
MSVRAKSFPSPRGNKVEVAISSGVSDEKSYPLNEAILLYGGETKIAIIHRVVMADGEPSLGEGHPLNLEALGSVVRALTSANTGQAQARRVTPSQVLYNDATMLAWWVPVAKRQIWFKSGRRALDNRSGKEVWHPAILFVATPNRLKVYALDGFSEERPTDTTPLYVAPYYNIYQDGAMCQGNTTYPKSLAPDAIAEWEKAFFDTNFTHANTTKLLPKESHDTFWKASEWRRPNAKYLLTHPTYKTIGEVLNANK